MFSDDEIKPTADGNFMRPGDEIISIREVCLSEKFDRKDFSLPGDAIGKSDLDAFFPEPVEQTRFAWTEEDGIAALVSGFGCSAPTSPGGLAAGRGALKHADISPRSSSRKSLSDTDSISSSGSRRQARNPPNASKLDKSDPRTRLHYVKYLKRHGKTVKLWECGICSREFQHQYTLMRHLPTHTDERNFHCDVCTKSFRQLSTLSQHKAIHSADRPYSCEVCKKTFNRVSTLISHRKTHSNDKPYKCHLCPKGFHQKGNLRNHLFTHTNERPYRCHVCSAGFNQQSNLVCHKNKAHPEIVDNVDVNSLSNNILVHQKSTSETLKSSGQFNEVSSSSTDTFVEPKTDSIFWTMEPWSSMTTTGVLVEPIRTYHMGVAVAMNQTPFALLKPDEGPPVLVKVVDPKIPGGKQLLVPATSEDLRLGGKVVNSEEENNQIRVPVVAAVVSRRRPGGGVSLAVEEPHHAHRHDDTDDGSFSRAPHDPCPSTANLRPPLPSCSPRDYSINNDSHTSCDVPLAPTPPLDLVSLDLFEHMESMCVGQYLYRSHV